MNIEEEIAQVIANAFFAMEAGYTPTEAWEIPAPSPGEHAIAAVLMPLFRRAQAEALREAAGEIEATFADHDRRRPLHPKAEVATDYVNDSQWAELIVRNRADRIEQNSEGNET